MRLLLIFCIGFFGVINILLSQNYIETKNGRLLFQSNTVHFSSFRAPENQTNTIHYIWPRNPPLAGEALVFDNSGELIWKNVSASAGDIGSGTPASGAFTSLSANNNFSVLPTGTGAGNTGQVRWYELAANGTNYTAFKAADAMAANVVYTLPSADGSSGNMLTTNGSGTLSWTSTVTGSNISASGNLTVNGNSALGDANTDVTSLKGSLRVYDTDATNYTDIKGPDGTVQSGNLNFILPTNAGSSNNMLITDGSGNLSWSSAVNGSSVTASGDLAIGGNTTIAGNTTLGDGSGDVTSLNGTLRVYDTDGSHYTDIKGGNGAIQAANLNFILPTDAGSNGKVLTTNGSGALSWTTPSPDWSAPGTIGATTPNTGAFTTLSASGAMSLQPTGTGAGNTGEIRWYELAVNGSNYTAFKAADAMGGNVTYTLPSADGSSGNMLTTNGSGVLSWSSSVNTTNVTASGNLAVNGNTALGDANTDVTSLKGSLRVFDTDATHYTEIKGPDGTAQTANLNFILPTNGGSANNMLITDGSGNLSWTSAVNGSNVTASGDLSVGGNTALGNGSGDITSLTGTFRVYDSDGTNYTDIKGPNGATQTVNLDFILPSNAGSSGQVLSTDGSGNLSWVTATPNWSAPGTIGATTPNTGAFTTLSASGTLTASGNMSVQPTGTGAGNTGEIRWYELVANGTNYTAFKAADAMATNVTYTLPSADGTSGQSLVTNGSGILSWSTTSPNWSAPGTIGSTTPNTGAFTTLSASNNISVLPTGTSAGNTGAIRWYELAANGTDYTAFKAADAMAAPVTYTLPSADGTAGYYLRTDGSGNLSWGAGGAGSDAISLQSYAVAATAPTSGQALVWNGTAWAPANPTSNIQKFILSEGTTIDIDLLRGATTYIDDVSLSAHSFFRMDNASANTDINGLQGGENGRIVYLFNNTIKNIVFMEEDTSSAANNRLILGVANKTINPGQVATFVYSTTKNRWICISTT